MSSSSPVAALPDRPVAALPRRVSWAEQALMILSKDIAIELRTGEVVTTSAFFGFVIVIMSSISFYDNDLARGQLAAGAIWLPTAFASVLSLSRTWQREREESALSGLLVTPTARSAIFAGKALGMAVFITMVELVVIPVTALFFAVDLARTGPGLGLFCLAATPGIAAVGTLFGVMTVRTRARDLVLASVLFPLLAPTLLAAVAGTRELFNGVPLADLADYFEIMGVFAVVFTAGGLWMFEILIEG